MNVPSNVLVLVQNIQKELNELGVCCEYKTKKDSLSNRYDEVITNKMLHKITEKLFKDGHYARAVEEAYKLLDNVVKEKSNQTNNSLCGSALMQNVFSPNKPILRLNSMRTTSEMDEQKGYMQIYAGCMTGIRNPRAHDSNWNDDEKSALQLIAFCNHLIERVQLSEVSINE